MTGPFGLMVLETLLIPPARWPATVSGYGPAFAGEDPSAWWQRTVEVAALYRLVRHGWHWGPAGRQTRREELFRPFGAEGLGW
jgi:hypothetical protein